jgi:hypothetical protein
MPTRRISFTNFNHRLVLAGGREQTGEGGLRRASGVAPEVTTSIMSRWGSEALYPIDATQLYYWNGHRYQYDGSKLYRDGSAVQTGFNGESIAINSMAPQPGIPDYLFINGGGITPFKIDPGGQLWNWGIVAPPNGALAQNLPNDQVVIDTFDGTAANWTATANCTKANNNTEFIVGSGSLAINPTGSPWHIVRTLATPLDLENYANGDISIGTDIFQIWVLFTYANLAQAHFLQIDFDVFDGTFKEYYSAAIGLVPVGVAIGKVGNQIGRPVIFDVTVTPGQWLQLTWSKSQCSRVGSRLQYDWTNVGKIRISGNDVIKNYLLDDLTLSGGSALGAGPAAGNGGSEYDYRTVYRNLVTGSQSNPNADATKVFGVSVNKVQLSNIPISPDPQVGARDLYRTSALNVAGGGIAFFLDTIYDNSTTSYLDSIADFSVPIVATPWQKSSSVPPNPAATAYYIDAGNGYYFKLTTAGTTGAAPPQWSVPTTSWVAKGAFVLGETTSQPTAGGVFWQVTTAGVSGNIQPNWNQAGPIIDGTVVWTSLGLQTTADGSVSWRFEGINSTRTLGADAVLFDNAPPQSTYGDAFGPFEGSMLWTRDSSPGKSGYVYMSPPGRPESVAQAFLVSGTNDPMQRIVEWDGRLWPISTARAYRSSGSYPAIIFPSVDDSLGTLQPLTVVPVKLLGIFYWAPDGIRVLNWSGSTVVGFRELATIFRGQGEENVPAWNATTGPVWAEEVRNEVIFSDGETLTLALLYDGTNAPVWRMPGRILTAGFYEHQTGEFQAAFGGKVYLFEHPGALTDG